MSFVEMALNYPVQTTLTYFILGLIVEIMFLHETNMSIKDIERELNRR